MVLPCASTLGPILLTSDQSCLTNFAGDKKLWSSYMSIGNISSQIRNKPASQAWICIGLLPIGPKRTQRIKGFTIQQQEYDTLTVQHKILEHILEPLSCIYQVFYHIWPLKVYY